MVGTLPARFFQVVPGLQLLLLLGGQKLCDRCIDGRDKPGVDRDEGRVGDVPAPESPTDDHTERVRVNVPDDDAAGNKVSSLPGQLGGGKCVCEDEVVIPPRTSNEMALTS